MFGVGGWIVRCGIAHRAICGMNNWTATLAHFRFRRNLCCRPGTAIYAAMQNVATLLTDPARADLSELTIANAGDALVAAGAEIVNLDWLDEAIACDVVFEGLDCRTARRALAEPLRDIPCDMVVQPRQGRRKDLLVADMDATIVTGETLDDLAETAGLKEPIAAITARAMNGEIDFKDALQERVAMLKGLPVSALEETVDRIRLTDGARTLVQTMREFGAYTVLVSGGFKFFTSRIAAAVGFHADQANRLEIIDHRLSGRVVEPILDKAAKLAALRRFAGDHNIPMSETLATGDGANDLPMIQKAGMGVAFRAKPAVAAKAKICIRHGDLTALLYLQGYRGGEFHR